MSTERESDAEQEDTVGHYDNREANPNSGGPRGLEGDMGISSERTGPLGDDPRSSGTGIEGTGTKGSALRSTDGETDTRPTEHDAVDVSKDDLADHERETAVTDDTGTWQGVDRTVGEPKPHGIEDEKVRRRG